MWFGLREHRQEMVPYSPKILSPKILWFPANFPGWNLQISFLEVEKKWHRGTRDPPWPTNMWLEDNHPYLYPNPQYIRQCHEVWNFISRYISTQYTPYCWWNIYIYSSISTYVPYISKMWLLRNPLYTCRIIIPVGKYILLICCFPSNFSSSKVFKGPTKGQFACELCDTYAGVWCDFVFFLEITMGNTCCVVLRWQTNIAEASRNTNWESQIEKNNAISQKKGTNRNWRTDWHWAKKHEDKPQTKIGKIHNKQRNFIFYNILQISKYTYAYMVVLTQLGLIQTATGSDCPLLQSCGGSKTDRLRCHDLARDIWWWKWGKGWTVCNNLGCLEIQTFPSGACAFGETTGLCVMRQALLWPCWILICKKGCSHTWPICITTAAFSI